MTLFAGLITMSTPFCTPDICDQLGDKARVLDPLFRNFGGRQAFCGEAVTVKCFEDNSKVKALASQPGAGRVMVVDGGGSQRRALLGDLIASQAQVNGWAGLVIYGCVRDVDVLATLDLGVQALNACPVKTDKRDLGDIDVPVRFGGQTIVPGDYIYADNNGILVTDRPL